MDTLIGLMRVVLLWALLGFSACASAQTVSYYFATGNNDAGPYPSAVALCAAIPRSGPYENQSGLAWVEDKVEGDSYNKVCNSYYRSVSQPTAALTAYARDSARRYTCGSGPFYATPCDVPPTCAIGVSQPGITWNIGYRTGPSANSPLVAPIDIGAVANQAFCTGSCLIIQDTGPGSPAGAAQTQGPATPGGYYPVVYTKNFITNGAQCTVSAVTPGTNPAGGAPIDVVKPPSIPSVGPDKCPPGTISGGIDSGGTPICIGTATPATTTKTETAPPVVVNNADGTTTTTTTTKITNSDGSVTTNTKTVISGRTNADGTAAGDQVSAGTRTGTNAQGLPGKPDGAADKPQDLCKLHPELNICKNSSVSGSCESTACDGDAIQCAVLRTANAQRCDELKDNDLSKGALAVSGNKMDGLPTTANANVVDLGIAGGQLDQNGWLGGGSCFADKSVTVGGRTLVMKLSVVCPYLENLKYAVMLAALLVAYKMVAGTILKEV